MQSNSVSLPDSTVFMSLHIGKSMTIVRSEVVDVYVWSGDVVSVLYGSVCYH